MHITKALELIEFGWPVVPLHGVVYDPKGMPLCSCSKPKECRSPAKHPRTSEGLKNASTKVDWVKVWWRRWPSANIGMVTGATAGIVVLDVDPAHGGEDSLDNLLVKHGKLPDTPEVLTGGGGRHLYFKHPGGELRNSAGQLGAGLDVRGDGGYVVGPGSTHISGRTYDWEASSTPDQVGVAPMPRWLVDGLTYSLRSTGSGCAPSAVGGYVREGGRNAWLTSMAGAMRRKGAEELALAQALWCINQEQCVPPLDKDEVLAIAKSVARYPPSWGHA
jgi:Bifunctional DNA primase/polymerase, N-terminal/Primase C terminal 1 (PriCT-1)